MDALELLVNKGRNIPVRLDLLPQLESQLSGAKTWKDRTARTFLRKNSHYTLMEVSEHLVFIMKLCFNISLIHSLLIMWFSFPLLAKEVYTSRPSLNIPCILAILSGWGRKVVPGSWNEVKMIVILCHVSRTAQLIVIVVAAWYRKS